MIDYFINRPYPGRGIIFGLNDADGDVFGAYFLMGRSKNSRNRILKYDNQKVVAGPYDASLIEDPSLIFYTPVQQLLNHTIITNGVQTDAIYDCLKKGAGFKEALNDFLYEPDKPHYTPRISGLLTLKENNAPLLSLSIIHKAKNSDKCVKLFFDTVLLPGKYYLVHTYEGEENNTLLPFCGPPVELNMPKGCLKTLSALLWDSLNKDNRISLYATNITPVTGISNGILYNAADTKE